MIRNVKRKAEFVQQWVVIKKLCRGDRTYMVDMVAFTQTLPDEHYNLPFELAYSVLGEVLDELRQHSGLPYQRNLEAKMKDSLKGKPPVPWQNYKSVENGRLARNKLAHKGVIAPKANCLMFIEAIEQEFKAWHVL